MVVEDDDLNQKIYELILSENYNLTLCKNSNEFYSVLTQNKYDLFIIDLSLPGVVDGIEIIKSLRRMENYSSTPIVVVTAHAFKRDELAALEAGASLFLRKPVNNELIIKEINKLLDSSL